MSKHRKGKLLITTDENGNDYHHIGNEWVSEEEYKIEEAYRLRRDALKREYFGETQEDDWGVW